MLMADIVTKRVPKKRVFLAGKTCSVDGCGRPAKTKMLCVKHYNRLRATGSPTGLKIGERYETMEWLVAHTNWEADDCLIWPFRRTDRGYPVLGSNLRAHRVMCIVAHGEGRPDQEVLHSCGNGHLGCVNPKHLRWGTHQENMDDMKAHGTARRELGKHKNVKLTEDAVRAIRSAPRGYGQTKRVAEQYGISVQNVGSIRSGRSWRWVR
jgi:hypothetical protein